MTFVAVTGSCGKSTTVHLLRGLLGGHLRGVTSPGDANCGEPLVRNLLRAAPGDDYCVQELGVWGPGTLDRGLELVRPLISVVLNVRRDHYSAFHGLANTQAEKAKLVVVLPGDGVALLNADDPLVREMAAMTPARVMTFGRSPDADLRATEVSACWPERLSFSLHWAGEQRQVQTRLVGEHGLGSALAALGVAISMGVPVDDALGALASIEPLARRMSPVDFDDGTTFIRDDFKAPSDSLAEAVRFMASARASRKVAVVGRISDHPGRSRRPYTEFARAACDVVDELVFVGERPNSLWAGTEVPWTVFRTVEAASRGLTLRRGDLVLLKGSGPADHLERILLDRTVGVRCWLTTCGRVIGCDQCAQLHSPASAT